MVCPLPSLHALTTTPAVKGGAGPERPGRAPRNFESDSPCKHDACQSRRRPVLPVHVVCTMESSEAAWIDELAASRRERHEAGALVSGRNSDGSPFVRLHLPPPATSSSRAMLRHLLQEFASEQKSAACSLLERSVRIEVGSWPADDARQGCGVELVFTAPGPQRLSLDQLKHLATRFEAFLDHQVKTCKAALHCNMRRHFAQLQLRLAAAEHPRLFRSVTAAK